MGQQPGLVDVADGWTGAWLPLHNVEAAHLAKVNGLHEVKPNSICTVGLAEGYRVKCVAQGLAHFQAILQAQPVMGIHDGLTEDCD